MDPQLEIRKLPPSVVRELGDILDHGGYWIELMAIIPKQLSVSTFEISVSQNNLPKYNTEHIQLIDQGAQRLRKSPMTILLDEWGTSGRPRPCLGNLLHLLTEAKLYRAADYISDTLLKVGPVSRPQYGPAAIVLIDDNDLKNDTASFGYNGNSLDSDVRNQGQQIDIGNNNKNIKRKRNLDSLIQEIASPLEKFNTSKNLNAVTNCCVSFNKGACIDKYEKETEVQVYTKYKGTINSSALLDQHNSQKTPKRKRYLMGFINRRRSVPNMRTSDLIKFSDSLFTDESPSIDNNYYRSSERKTKIDKDISTFQVPATHTSLSDILAAEVLPGEADIPRISFLLGVSTYRCTYVPDHRSMVDRYEEHAKVDEKLKYEEIPQLLKYINLEDDDNSLPNIPAFSNLLTDPAFCIDESRVPAYSGFVLKTQRRFSV